tara:strand:+ start:1120 stop:2016 length:897 start_codon:yes stop_codon:yes gene_type:complete
MRKISYLIFIILFFCCGTAGIEGYVNQPITITANNPEEGQDVDYEWFIMNQPDGSLLNSDDLIASDDGQEMVFTPDYPGDYSIEVLLSQYGDEFSSQTFQFSILEENEITLDEEKNEDDDSWLNEEIDDTEIQKNKINKNSQSENDEYEDGSEIDSNYFTINDNRMSEKDRTGIASMGQVETENQNNNKPNTDSRFEEKIIAQIEKPKASESIAAKTDRFTIQITSKRMLKDAQLFSQELIKQGYDSYIQKAIFKSDEIWYRVRVGSYDNYNSAKIAADALANKLGMATWVDFVRKEQ